MNEATKIFNSLNCHLSLEKIPSIEEMSEEVAQCITGLLQKHTPNDIKNAINYFVRAGGTDTRIFTQDELVNELLEQAKDEN